MSHRAAGEQGTVATAATAGLPARFPDGDFRSRYFRGDRRAQVERRVRALTEDLGISSDQTADVVLRFVLASPAVSTVIAGMRSVGNVERNVATMDRPPLSAEQIAKLKNHRWERNFYAAD
jgi:aryl-alcohol dehydrogenase-like predicted oxidoreductase